jgi:hypothetical protein
VLGRVVSLSEQTAHNLRSFIVGKQSSQSGLITTRYGYLTDILEAHCYLIAQLIRRGGAVSTDSCARLKHFSKSYWRAALNRADA